MNQKRDNVILHADANSFFVSVSTALNPELKGKAVAVAGSKELRHGIILAKSEVAKSYGVKTAEPIWEAKRKCPKLIIIPPLYQEYVEFSRKLFDMYTSYTDKVESFGLDECWLDCTESQNLYGDGQTIANELRRRAREELGITLSVGVSFTKVFSKLGSDYKKPDATTVIDRSNYKKIAWGLPITDMLMVGRQTAKTCEKMNIRTIGDIARCNPLLLEKKLGVIGMKLYEYANGTDAEKVNYYYSHHVPESVGNGTTLYRDITDGNEITAVITSLSDIVATRLRRHLLKAFGVKLTLKFSDMTYSGKQSLLQTPTDTASDIASACETLLPVVRIGSKSIRAITVTAYKLTNENVEQMSIFSDCRSDKLNGTIDNLRKKYGFSVINSGIVKEYDDLCRNLKDDSSLSLKKSIPSNEETIE